MAKKAKTKGPESLHQMTAQELEARLQDVQENHFRLRFRHASNPLKNPMEIRQARREVARLKTILRTKEKETV
ncbi:MAG: 50S ribosomal protein L29 [Elusimicrobiota bacterium]|jgi:large subunit ribosomal protein L29